MKKENVKQCRDMSSEPNQDYFFDDTCPEEPQLWEYEGYGKYDGNYDCKDCVFRTLFTERVTEGVAQLRREAGLK